MAASQRLKQQRDILDSLKELSELIKNPALITTAQETARNQMALSETEEARTIAAREFLAKYESLAAGLKQREDALALAQKEHNILVSTHVGYVNSKSREFDNLAGMLNAKAKQQAETDKAHMVERKALDAISLSHVSEIKILAEENRKLDAKIAYAQDLERRNESARVSNDEDARLLKKKMAKLREIAEI